jgi:hypothetical protein
MFRSTRTQESRKPEETAVFQSVAVGLWSSTDANGRYSLRFDLSRKDAEGRIRRTFRPEHLLELPYAIASVARAFSQAPKLSEELRRELAHLASVLDKALASAAGNGGTNDQASPSDRVFG